MPISDTRTSSHISTLSDDQRWQAVLAREASCDGQFVFAVRTTGIYCRPSCSSRLARRENVRFFATPLLAERAGFRACKKCHPQSAVRPIHPAVVATCQRIEHSSTPLTLDELAAEVGLTGPHLQRIFRRTLGVSPKQYALAEREQRLHQQLEAGASILDAMHASGARSTSQIYGPKSARSGLSPAERRRQAATTTLATIVAPTWLGSLAIAATERGIVAMELADSAAAAEQLLRKRFPRAAFIPASEQLTRWALLAVASIERPAQSVELPLDVQGTAFQRRVWQELQNIPAGATRTYQQIARAIGQPTAARAVGTACGKNPIAVAVPCHRAVTQSGRITGYRWGKDRKAKLLERESLP